MLIVSNYCFAQNAKQFCNAVEKSNFNKVERIVHRLIKKNKTGQTYYNGPGSGYQINLTPCYDTMVHWLKQQPCVADAFWDKCQMKLLSYPGHSSVGVRFKSDTGFVEKCFLIQEGTTGQVNLFGWRPKLFKSKMKLVYKKMFDCNGFVESQKKMCEEK